MIIFAFKKGELKEKTQDANFSLPIKNPNPLFKNVFWIRIPKLVKNGADSGSQIRIRIANPNFIGIPSIPIEKIAKRHS